MYTLSVTSHDKSLNSRLQGLWAEPRRVPLGAVVPANNTWMENAFVADASRENGKAVAILVLDDHYRSGDPTLRSESGVIGDPISKPLLCSIPSQARAKKVTLDPVVRRMINSECGRGTA